MAQIVADDKRRISYLEDRETLAVLKEIAKDTDLTASDHIRNAIYIYLQTKQATTKFTTNAKCTRA